MLVELGLYRVLKRIDVINVEMKIKKTLKKRQKRGENNNKKKRW